MVIIFPDSTWNFKPFELIRTEAELTQTEGDRSRDAIIFHLRSFELIESFVLKIPFQFHNGGDTTTLYEQSDTLWLRQQVASLSPPPPFQIETGIFGLKDPPNYSLWITIGLVMLVLLALAIRSLQKPLRKYWAKRKVRGEWNGIRRRLKDLPENDPAAFLDGLNTAWKDYLARSQPLPLRSLTTTELKQHLPELQEVDEGGKHTLLEIAQTGDRVVYAAQPIEQKVLTKLREECSQILDKVFQQRLSQI